MVVGNSSHKPRFGSIDKNVSPTIMTSPGKSSGLIEDMDQDINGNRYGLDHNGIIYKIDTSNVLTQVANIQATGGAGLYYSQNTDQLYAAGQQTVSLYGPLNNSNTSQFKVA